MTYACRRSASFCLFVAWIERSDIRKRQASRTIVPDFAPLNPGYRRALLFVPQDVMVMTTGATAGII
jgi:hypothetical protein